MEVKEIDKFYKKKINFFSKVLSQFEKNESYYRDYFISYLEKDIHTFQREGYMFGEKRIFTIDFYQFFGAYTYSYKIPTSILQFEKGDTNSFIQGYYYDVLFQIYSYIQNKEPNGLHTDLSLSVLFCLSFFPDDIKEITNILYNFLAKNKEKFTKFPERIDFGFKSTLYLMVELLKLYGYNDYSEQLIEFLRYPINEYYMNIIKQLHNYNSNEFYCAIEKLCEFHIQNSKSDLTLPFNKERWQYFPIEILSIIIYLRKKGITLKSYNALIQRFIPLIQDDIIIDKQELVFIKKKILSKQ